MAQYYYLGGNEENREKGLLNGAKTTEKNPNKNTS